MGKSINLVGQKFERLTVISKTDKRTSNGSVLWECQCECGNITLATSADLKSGHKKSCGCLQKEKAKQTGHKNLKDLVGQKFGLLTVVEKSHVKKTQSGSTKVYWKCKCDCGNECVIVGNSLVTGNTRSCGCIKSLGEQRISELLRDAQIPFVKEEIFEPSGSSAGGSLRFDFYVDNKYVIEYDGKQHYQEGWNGDTLKEVQRRDTEKNTYCFNNGIPIIRIPYTHYPDLELKDLLLETTSFLKEPSL